MPEKRRLVGLETEYGCLVGEGLHMHQAIGQLRDWFFENQRYGLIDRHHRDWDEPPGNGGFLFNGGRVYEDMGHLEMCTPECTSYLDVVRYDRANDWMLGQALRELELEDCVSVIRNNIDHYTGATFGCHENYSMRRDMEVSDGAIFSLLTFLTLRSLYTGAGRVGGLETQRRPTPDRAGVLLKHYHGFQMTQRADYVENDFFRWVQGNRAIINTRDEPLADPDRFRRLHLLHGDTNVLPSATFLKVGSTALILDLLELKELPEQRLRDPVTTLKQLSYQPGGSWEVINHEGEALLAVEVLEMYRQRAVRCFQGRDEETDIVLSLWKRVDEALLRNESNDLVGLIDWKTKLFLFEQFCEVEGITLRDPWLEAQDLEYHHILPERSLGLPLSQEGPWSLELGKAISEAPKSTRAQVRSRLMRRIDPVHDDYIVDWDGVRWNDQMAVLTDPYEMDPRIQECLESLTDRLKEWAPEDLD